MHGLRLFVRERVSMFSGRVRELQVLVVGCEAADKHLVLLWLIYCDLLET